MLPDEKEKWPSIEKWPPIDDDFFPAMDKLGDVDCYEENELLDIAALLSPENLQEIASPSLYLIDIEVIESGPQVNSEKSIPSSSRAMMSTSEIQNYDGPSHNLSGYSNHNEPKTTAMHCGQKRKETADNLEAQKYRRVDNISFPLHRRNSPPVSNQSNHTQSDQWLGNPTTEEINMPEGRAFESHELKATYTMLSLETLMLDALENISHSLQNGMPCEDRCETSTERNNQERETHFGEQPTEIQRNNPERQAFVETIEGHSIPIAITDHDIVDLPTHMGAQFSLGSTSTQPSSSFSSIENIKLRFDYLTALPLEVLMEPGNETSMKKVLVILKDNLSSFSEKQRGQIEELCVDFPALVSIWREWHSQSQMYRQQAETKKIRDLAGKDEESLRVRYVLEDKEKELMRLLDEVKRRKAEIGEQRTEKSKLTKDLKEKEAHRNKKEQLMTIATAKLNELSAEWAKIQSFFK